MLTPELRLYEDLPTTYQGAWLLVVQLGSLILINSNKNKVLINKNKLVTRFGVIHRERRL